MGAGISRAVLILSMHLEKGIGHFNMRLDKFLKVSRLIKRRSVANEACDGHRVSVNGKVAKASLAIKPGDVIELRFGDKTLKVQVQNISEHATKADAPAMYIEV